jgi:hypothetical protein
MTVAECGWMIPRADGRWLLVWLFPPTPPELDKACVRLRPRVALDLAAGVQARDIGLVVMAGRINDSVGGGPPAGNMVAQFSAVCLCLPGAPT